MLKLKLTNRTVVLFRLRLNSLSSIWTNSFPANLDLSKALEAASRLESWIEKLREHANHVLQRGGKIPGWKLVQKNSPRRWKDEEITRAEALRDLGDKAFSPKELLSPNQVEKAFGGTKDLKKKIKDWVEKRTIKESSGTTMVKESDPRLAVSPLQNVYTTIDVTEVPKKRSKDSGETAKEKKAQKRTT